MYSAHPIFASFRAILGLISTLGLSVLLYTANSDAAQVTLAWNDPNTSGFVAGYNIHYGTASGQYGSTQDVGTNNPATVPGLANGTTYCFVATAYDRSGSESAFSNQVCTTTPVSTSPLQSIAVTPANPTIQTGGTQQFTATGTYSDNSTQNLTSQVTWTSSKPAVATIGAGGLAAAVSAGGTTISAALSGVPGSTGLTVQAAPPAPTLQSIAVIPANPTILPGGTVQFTATGTYSDGSAQNLTSQVTWNSNKTTVATITGGGLATAVGAGSTTISAALSGVPGSTGLTVQAAQPPPTTQATIFGSALPGTADSGPDSAVELGVKFRSDVAGTITGIRFYKGSGNTGTHVGNLWSSSGTKLASVTFSGETTSGWQQANFSTPLSITANTVYVASYNTTVGHYADDQNYFATTGVDNPPLHALQNGVSGGNGVYAYGSTSSFPNQTWNTSNYWVDVVFSSGSAPPLQSIAVTPANPTIQTGGTQQFTATGTYSDNSTQNLTSQVTWTSSKPAVATIDAGGLAAAVSAGGTTISAALSGVPGSTGLTVQAAQPPPTTQATIFGSALPGTADSGPDSAVELGVKFRSDVAGTITGIRFYKGSGNTGTHVGNLWSSSGTKLASVTFSGETTSGWQQANFSTPLSITANTVYVASYNTTVGHYADDQNYFATTGVDNPPLHALQNGVSGGNGVYAYGSTSSFPNQTWNTSNYWVDVVFVPSSGTQQTLALTQSASTQISVAGVSTPAGDVQPDAVTAAQALSFTELPDELRTLLTERHATIRDLFGSADKRRMVFSTEAALVPEDTNSVEDVYLYDADTGLLSRASLTDRGLQANGPSYSPRINGPGTVVAFVSEADNLVGADTNGVADVFVRDLDANTLERVGFDEWGVQAQQPALDPDLCGRGELVVFDRPGQDGLRQVYLYSLNSGFTERLSPDLTETGASTDNSHPALSPDGRYAAYLEQAQDTDGQQYREYRAVVILDRLTGGAVRVPWPNGLDDAEARIPHFSDDGRFVMWISRAQAPEEQSSSESTTLIQNPLTGPTAGN